MADVLVVDDEPSICLAFEQLLRSAGHAARTVGTVRAGLDECRRREPDVVFLDLRLPDGNGLDLLPSILECAPRARVIIMTAYGTVQAAVRAMQSGAFDYLPKPLDLVDVRRVLARAVPPDPALRFVPLAELGADDDNLIGRDPRMQDVFKLVGIVASSIVNVMIEGESGVGKELVARAIHEHGPRRDQPLVAINCSAIPETLLESELFGHERGAFTGAEERRPGKFEIAGDGTLFLDEIGDMPPALQAKILRALQERHFERVGGSERIPFRARIIAATHHDLERDIAAGRFREDLFFRLKVVSISIPPLRERRGDIPALVGLFIRQANGELGTRIEGIAADALAKLTLYDWPGNVRELENVVRRASVLARGLRLQLSDLPEHLRDAEAIDPADATAKIEQTVRDALRGTLHAGETDDPDLFWRLVRGAERGALLAALEAAGGNQVFASRLLGLNRGTLRRKMQEYGLFDESAEESPGELE